MDSRQIAAPQYFYRRLFWSYLLSGGGVTYGAGPTWYGWSTYDATAPSLAGLNDIDKITKTLAAAHIDLSLFRPQDSKVVVLTPTPPAPTWTDDTIEINRVQVAVRDGQEWLIYNPNGQIVAATDQTWPSETRRKIVEGSGRPKLRIDLSGLRDGAEYVYKWYSVDTTGPESQVVSSDPVTRTLSATNPYLEIAPPYIGSFGNEQPFAGDAVLHISSRCVGANKCLFMDGDPPPNRPSTIDGFLVGNSTIEKDPDVSVVGQSWRCNGNEGCLVAYDFPQPGIAVSSDIYFRRDTAGTEIEIQFEGTAPWPDPECANANPPDPSCPAYASVGVLTGVDADGVVYAKRCVHWNHWPPEYYGCTSNLLEGNVKAADLNRWYRLGASFNHKSSNEYTWRVSLDGVEIIPSFGWGTAFSWGDVLFHSGQVFAWSPTIDSSIWLDELAIDPLPADQSPGLLRRYFQQGLSDQPELGGYAGTTATFFDYSGGYNNTNQLHVGANNNTKSLLRFDLGDMPADAVIDEAILQLYHTGRTNANALTLGAHGVLADWVAAEANRTQRQAGVNWSAAGMASGTDYTAASAATAALTGAGNAWLDLDVTSLAQTWVSDSSQNHGLVLLQETASGSVIYSFCSELGWTPCMSAQAPRLTLRYHLAPPPPVKAVLRQGTAGYTGTKATYFDGSGSGYNSSAYLRVDADGAQKSLLRFDLPTTIPVTATVDEATLRLYEISRSNANGLTLAAHGVQAPWTDSQANRIQRQAGANWQVAGMGSGSDYTEAAVGVTPLASAGGVFVDVDVKSLVQGWVADPTTNHGLVLLAQDASGSVTYSFCSELGWTPCAAAQAPQLTVWYH